MNFSSWYSSSNSTNDTYDNRYDENGVEMVNQGYYRPLED